MKMQYRLIGRNLYKLTLNGQLKHVTIVPSFITNLSKALDWFESVQAVHLD